MSAFRRSAAVAALLVLAAIARPANATPIITGQINGPADTFGSSNVFQFANGSTAGESIASIAITLPSGLFFDTINTAPGTAPSGPTVGTSPGGTVTFTGGDTATLTGGVHELRCRPDVRVRSRRGPPPGTGARRHRQQ